MFATIGTEWPRGAESKASQLFLPSLQKSDIDPDIIANIEPKSVSMIAVAEISEELFINQWQQSPNFFLFFFFSDRLALQWFQWSSKIRIYRLLFESTKLRAYRILLRLHQVSFE